MTIVVDNAFTEFVVVANGYSATLAYVDGMTHYVAADATLSYFALRSSLLLLLLLLLLLIMLLLLFVIVIDAIPQ